MDPQLDYRIVKYVRHEFHGDEETCGGPLLYFVYDIPYFAACGVFPPLHVVNQIFGEGRRGGGMSPGASWEPFTISLSEYESLTKGVQATPVAQIQPHARYAELQYIFDSRFDGILNRTEWVRAVCEEHRDEFHRRLDAIYGTET